MRAGIVVNVTRADRHRLEAIISDRSAPQKHVRRANISRTCWRRLYAAHRWLVKRSHGYWIVSAPAVEVNFPCHDGAPTCDTPQRVITRRTRAGGLAQVVDVAAERFGQPKIPSS